MPSKGIIPAYAGSTRGRAFYICDASRIIPAYAGSTRQERRPPRAAGDHPRVRGEHSLEWPGPLPLPGSSPRTRGARRRWHDGFIHGGIIPAYAGSTLAAFVISRWRWDHPRVRGEHPKGRANSCARWGSSPRTRGAPSETPRLCGASGIIPAYAGSTLYQVGESRLLQDHPRVRGEHVELIEDALLPAGSSPRTRGARSAPTTWKPSSGIIPAYAGSTAIHVGYGLAPWDHPRVRGEHVSVVLFAGLILGSSPRTRGAREGLTSRRFAPRDHPRVRGEHLWVRG